MDGTVEKNPFAAGYGINAKIPILKSIRDYFFDWHMPNGIFYILNQRFFQLSGVVLSQHRSSIRRPVLRFMLQTNIYF